MRGTGEEKVMLSMMDSCYRRKCLSAQTSGASPKMKFESMALHSSGNGKFPSLNTVSLYGNGVIRQDRKG